LTDSDNKRCIFVKQPLLRCLPFKVQVNFDIPIFEGQIDVDALENWLNLLEGYLSINSFSNREKITFVLLKVFPMSNICERLTVRNTPHRSLKYLGPSTLGTLLWMFSRIQLYRIPEVDPSTSISFLSTKQRRKVNVKFRSFSKKGTFNQAPHLVESQSWSYRRNMGPRNFVFIT